MSTKDRSGSLRGEHEYTFWCWGMALLGENWESWAERQGRRKKDMGNFVYTLFVHSHLPFLMSTSPCVCGCDIYAHGFNGIRHVLKWDFDSMYVK